MRGSDLLDHPDHIPHEGGARQARRTSSAVAMAALIHEDHTEGVRERRSRGNELARTAGKAVKQQQRWAIASEVPHRDGCRPAVNEPRDLAGHAVRKGAIAAT